MEDYYILDDAFGGSTKASGKMKVGNDNVHFSLEAYGAIYDVVIDGIEYQQVCGGTDGPDLGARAFNNDWRYSKDNKPVEFGLLYQLLSKFDNQSRSGGETMKMLDISELGKDEQADMRNMTPEQQAEHMKSREPAYILSHIVNGKIVDSREVPDYEDSMVKLDDPIRKIADYIEEE
jgi:hypothetical protein